jgi:hypothetical protein
VIDDLSTGTDIRAVQTLVATADPARERLSVAERERLNALGQQLRQRAPGGEPTTDTRGGRATAALELVGWVGRRRRAARRRRLLIGGTLPVVLALSAAGWAIATRHASQLTDSVGCYAAARLDANIDIVSATGDQPTALCANDWTSGPLHTRLPAGATAPPLVACVLPRGGAVGVFPDTTCATLRLQPLPAGYGDAAAKFVGLRNDLRDQFAQTRCVSISDGVQLAHQALVRHGFSGWTVKTTQTGPDTPCAAFAPDSEHHTITVVGQISPNLTDAVDRALNSVNGTCLAGTTPTDPDAARAAVIDALSRAGYGKWTVTVSGDQQATTQQPCYSASFDPHTHNISFSTYARG